MERLARYFRLLSSFARFSLANEMAFRGNFIVKVLVEVLWLGILLVFYDTLFTHTGDVAGWNAHQYLFFLGCYYTLEGTIRRRCSWRTPWSSPNWCAPATSTFICSSRSTNNSSSACARSTGPPPRNFCSA